MKPRNLARRRCSLQVDSLETRRLLSTSAPEIPMVSATTSTDSGSQVVYIAAVSHGYELPPLFGGVPAWETTMVNSLKASGNFKWVDAFDWKSWTGQPNYATNAGLKLANDIGKAVQNPNIVSPGSVVDIVLIGHSRGAVVVNRAFQALQNHLNKIKQLKGGTWQEVLLDPHPSNAATDGLRSYDPGFEGSAINAVYSSLQAKMKDPYPIKVPSLVSEVDDYWENTPVSELTTQSNKNNKENLFNVWGVPPGSGLVLTNTNTIMKYTPLTGPGIGHSEVHDWYQTNVVPTLK